MCKDSHKSIWQPIFVSFYQYFFCDWYELRSTHISYTSIFYFINFVVDSWITFVRVFSTYYDIFSVTVCIRISWIFISVAIFLANGEFVLVPLFFCLVIEELFACWIDFVFEWPKIMCLHLLYSLWCNQYYFVLFVFIYCRLITLERRTNNPLMNEINHQYDTPYHLLIKKY